MATLTLDDRPPGSGRPVLCASRPHASRLHAFLPHAFLPRPSMPVAFARAVAFLLAGLATAAAGEGQGKGQGQGQGQRQALTLAVLPVKLLDTSGEPTDQSAGHARRLGLLADELAADLSRSGPYRARVLPAPELDRACPSGEAACLLQAARSGGADLVFVGVVHKSSTLILQLFARLVDARTGHDVLSRDLNFRGDTDEAWRRARVFLAAQIRDAPPAPR